ncbi:MAG: glycosyltransferase, partial [Candidatus Pacebacteria bacterium]|nr:glycosyltransferase [Candidatus Paceibacterota bacterium]
LILVLGGSEGAQIINNNLLVIINDLLNDFELIHQTGENNIKQIKKETDFILQESNKPFYHPFGFLKDNELACAYFVSSLVISRAGAATIFEIAATGKPSILIPLSNSANKHQFKNAYTYSKMGASIVIEEDNFTPYFFLEKIKNLFKDEIELRKMGEKAKEFAVPSSTGVIAEYIVSYLKK